MDGKSMSDEAEQKPHTRNRTLAVLFGAVLLGALDIAIVGPALPAIRETFSLGSNELSWIFNIYILVSLISAPLLAAWSDRFGRRSIYLICLVTFTSGSVVVGLAPAFPILLLGRALQAVGAGGLLPVASAVIADTFPESKRGTALGLIGAVFGLAFLLGPILGGLLLHWSWRWLFLLNLPFLAILIPAAQRYLPAAGAKSQRALDWRGALALALTLGTVVWLLTRIEAIGAPQSSEWGLTILLGAIAIAALFALRRIEAAADNPILPASLMQSPRMRAVAVLAVATGCVEASMVFLPTLAVVAFDVAAKTASLMLLPLVASLIVGSVIAGRMLDRIGPRPVIQFGMTFVVLGLAILALLPPGFPSFYAGGLAVGLGLASLLGAPLRFVAQQVGGDTQRGASQGLLTVFLGCGRLAGAALIGGIVATEAAETDGFQAALLVVACLCFASLATTRWLVLDPRRKPA
jgi:MFS family permease